MSLIVACFVAAVALGVGVEVGRRRGPLLGVGACVGVLAAGAVGYFALLMLVLPT